MKNRKRTALLALLLSALLALTACGGDAQKDGGKNDVIKIGYVNPTTGALAGNGEGCAWVVRQIEDYVKAHPIRVDGREKTIQVIVYDSASDQNTCSVMTQKLIEEDKVDLIIAIQTPNTVIPVVQVAERYGVPCIATQAPIDPVANSLEEFKWTLNAFYTLDDVYESQRALWTQAGHAPGSGAKVGLLFANDADGSAWHSIFVRRLAEDGYEVVDPGQYPSGTTDFTNVANTFKAKEIDVIAGTNIPPDFMNAYNAIIGAGVEVDCVTMGKCCLLASDVEALGVLADGIMTQVWWAPTNPYSSQLTGISSKDLDAAYAKDNGGRTMPQPAAFAYAALELAVHTFAKAGTTERQKVRDAIGSLDVDTIVGHIRYDNVMNGLPYARTVLCGGQWQRENGQLVLKVIDNSLHPEIPLTGEYQPVNATKKQ
ncbi:MAG: ABC transporter substrate-binding protein [Clostridia bacterium]|nr:ABC transporter substrate-binding protein [Clostridia bacterium]